MCDLMGLTSSIFFGSPLRLCCPPKPSGGIFLGPHRSALMWGGMRGDILPLVGGISKSTSYNVLFGLFVGGMVRNENVL